jgi:hypothetical protein
MDVYVDRKKMDGLVKGAVRRTRSGRLLTDLTHELLYARMPEGSRARLLGTVSGGDDVHACSVWAIPGIGRRQLYVDRAKLGATIRTAEPWSPPPPPELAARQAAARLELARRRGVGLGGSAQLNLL